MDRYTQEMANRDAANLHGHTPGPWVHNAEDNIITAQGREHATLIEWQARSLHVSIEERDANARLIAAAPDLLAALKRCRFDSLNMSLADLEFCRAAIAKATKA